MKNSFDNEDAERRLEQTETVVLALIAAEEVDPDRMPLWKIAQAFNVRAEIVEQWVREGMPRRPDGAFSWAEVLEWKVSGAGE